MKEKALSVQEGLHAARNVTVGNPLRTGSVFGSIFGVVACFLVACLAALAIQALTPALNPNSADTQAYAYEYDSQFHCWISGKDGNVIAESGQIVYAVAGTTEMLNTTGIYIHVYDAAYGAHGGTTTDNGGYYGGSFIYFGWSVTVNGEKPPTIEDSDNFGATSGYLLTTVQEPTNANPEKIYKLVIPSVVEGDQVYISLHYQFSLPSSVGLLTDVTSVFGIVATPAATVIQKHFTDVANPREWYYDTVYYVAELGLITGYAPSYTTFGVGDLMTRADLVTIMWRYCEPDEYANYNEATAVNETDMPDVEDHTCYTGAVNWAVENEVITGYTLDDGSFIFAPSDPVTFDMMVTIVARYALGGINEAAGYPTTALSDPKFTDASTVEDWAEGSMSWAIDNEVVTGGDNGNGTYTLAPLDNVARERAATVLARSIQSKLIVTE